MLKFSSVISEVGESRLKMLVPRFLRGHFGSPLIENNNNSTRIFILYNAFKTILNKIKCKRKNELYRVFLQGNICGGMFSTRKFNMFHNSEILENCEIHLVSVYYV